MFLSDQKFGSKQKSYVAYYVAFWGGKFDIRSWPHPHQFHKKKNSNYMLKKLHPINR